jgi:hypothetical protein
MRQDEVPFRIVLKAACGELSPWEKEIRDEWVRDMGQIRVQGTQRRERLERADTEMRTIGTHCHHGDWLR